MSVVFISLDIGELISLTPAKTHAISPWWLSATHPNHRQSDTFEGDPGSTRSGLNRWGWLLLANIYIYIYILIIYIIKSIIIYIIFYIILYLYRRRT